MSKEQLIPIEKYAAQQRKSIYSIMQRANRGEIQAVVEEKEGKKQTYIVLSGDTPVAPEVKEDAPKAEELTDYKAAYEAMQKELEALKARLDERDGK